MNTQMENMKSNNVEVQELREGIASRENEVEKVKAMH